MGKDIRELEPRLLWDCFYQLTQIPRPSGHEGDAINHIENYALLLRPGISVVHTDDDNLIISAPATPGYENHKPVTLQGHIDMVPQKDPQSAHDFERDAIETIVEGNVVHANNTTLGADNGIGIAAAMAILADPEAQHGPLQIVITNNEETTMGGAFALDASLVRGKTLLNLDSEQEGEIYVGCAGGLNAVATFTHSNVETADEDIAFCVRISGLRGGHSGMDINLGRANANKLLTRFLKFAAANYEAMLAQIEGGNMHNAIPREAYAVITIDAEDREDFLEAIDEFEDIFRAEYAQTEPGLRFEATEVELPQTVMDEMSTDDLINALQGSPCGVLQMSPSIEGMVDTSVNLAIVHSYDNKIDVTFLIRSTIESQKEDVASQIESIFRLAGAEVTLTGDYPGWRPNESSELLKTVKDEWHKMQGTEAKVMMIHAGLECGIFASKAPDWDMVSFGPTIHHPHSPTESVEIDSVERFYALLKNVLKAL